MAKKYPKIKSGTKEYNRINMRKWRKKNRERDLELKKKWRDENKEHRKKYNQEYYSRPGVKIKKKYNYKRNLIQHEVYKKYQRKYQNEYAKSKGRKKYLIRQASYFKYKPIKCLINLCDGNPQLHHYTEPYTVDEVMPLCKQHHRKFD